MLVPTAFSLESLAAMSPSETTPVWLEVARQQAGRRSPAELMAQYERDLFVPPSIVDQRTSVTLDALILHAARGFEALLLSPLAPLGVCSSFGPTSQDRTISASRSLEVVSGVRVQFGAATAAGEFCPIGDLGVFDWVAKLTSSRKQRLVASGLGIQLVPLLFRETT